MSKISDRQLDDILQLCDITEIIAGYIPLKKAGRNFKALCPFHHEKSPSFVVSPDKQIFHCFGCGAGGDVFSFVMKNERMEFPEAVKFLADKVGVRIVTESEKDLGVKQSGATILYKLNELAAEYFHQNLLKSPSALKARDYLGKRGLSNESVNDFRLGFAPDLWDGLLTFLRSKKINDNLLLNSGLVIKNAQGRIYDRFRNRVMFPIFNATDKIVGFGGRTIDSAGDAQSQDKGPKYINSPETDIYIKSKNLYGFNLSKRFIQQEEYCIVVEGYLDFIVPFQAGVKNLVASLGTAFTHDHVRLLKRYTNNIVIVFDSDEAGQGAALRSLDLLIEEGMNVKIADLRLGFDPDSYVRKYGSDEFSNRVNAAKTLFDYKLDLLLLKFDRKSPEGKAQIAGIMLETIGRFKNAILRSELIKNLAESLSLAEETLIVELKKLNSSKQFFSKTDKSASLQKVCKKTKAAEKMLISLMLENRELIAQLKEKMHYSEFTDPITRKIVMHLYQSDEAAQPTSILKNLNDEEASFFICNLLVRETGVKDSGKSFEDCIRKIKTDGMQLKLDELQNQIKNPEQTEDELKELLKDYHSLKKEQRFHGKGKEKAEQKSC
ncbi:MAG: DNA primase [Candidatus Omnitrophica bacterium]|nr:DNA primase [Candidatus Omnitrophota bacterium]